jgi:hypothetical protein
MGIGEEDDEAKDLMTTRASAALELQAGSRRNEQLFDEAYAQNPSQLLVQQQVFSPQLRLVSAVPQTRMVSAVPQVPYTQAPEVVERIVERASAPIVQAMVPGMASGMASTMMPAQGRAARVIGGGISEPLKLMQTQAAFVQMQSVAAPPAYASAPQVRHGSFKMKMTPGEAKQWFDAKVKEVVRSRDLEEHTFVSFHVEWREKPASFSSGFLLEELGDQGVTISTTGSWKVCGVVVASLAAVLSKLANFTKSCSKCTVHLMHRSDMGLPLTYMTEFLMGVSIDQEYDVDFTLPP